jgi:hypothetical protein
LSKAIAVARQLAVLQTIFGSRPMFVLRVLKKARNAPTSIPMAGKSSINLLIAVIPPPTFALMWGTASTHANNLMTLETLLLTEAPGQARAECHYKKSPHTSLCTFAERICYIYLLIRCSYYITSPLGEGSDVETTTMSRSWQRTRICATKGLQKPHVLLTR